MKNIKFSHEGVEYEVDLQKAIDKGLAKKVRIPIESVIDGDVFINPITGALCAYFHLKTSHYLIYRDRSALSFYSEEGVIELLNSRKLELVGNKLNIWNSIFE